MPWFKVDDGFHGHPKVMDLSLAAVGLWTLAGTWCANYLTDGEIPLKAIVRLGGTKKQAKELVISGLWAETSAEIYQFCDWDHYQPTKETVEAEREKARERMGELRAKRKGTAKTETPESSGQTDNVQANNERTDPERSAEQTDNDNGTDPERSDEVRVAPSLPLSPSPSQVPLKEEKTSPTPSEDEDPKPFVYPPAFEAFWDAYPRKVGKRAALAAFNKARKTDTLQAICTGASRYGEDPNLPEEEFIPHPSKWLNEGRWIDGPLSPRNVPQARPSSSDARARAGFERLDSYDQTGRTAFTPQLELGA